MNYCEFEKIMSSERMTRYVNACGGDTRKGMKLYRMNLHLSEEMFTIVSCYEVALRNAIDKIMVASNGTDWLRDAIQPGGLYVIRDDKVDHAAGSWAVLERQEVPHLPGIDASSGRSQVHPHQDAVSLRMVHTADETAEGKPQILSCSSA